jgi:hypothetical protein
MWEIEINRPEILTINYWKGQFEWLNELLPQCEDCGKYSIWIKKVPVHNLCDDPYRKPLCKECREKLKKPKQVLKVR